MNQNDKQGDDHKRPDQRITREMILAEGEALLSQPITNDNEQTASHLRAKAKDKIPCLLDPILPRVGLACLAGSSDTGKSALLRQFAAVVAAGEEEFLGFPILAQQRSVLYVSTEDGEEATAYLLKRQTQHYVDKDIEQLRFLFDYDDVVETLDINLTRVPADLVVIDCFADVFGGDLKDTTKIRASLADYAVLARKHKCCILFLHHTAKRTEGLIPSKNNLLSGQGLEARMRVVIELRADPLRPNDRHFCIVKGNYLSKTMKNESYVLRYDEATLTFTNTGERVPFENLVRGEEVDAAKEKWEEAKRLKAQGMSYAKIADAMGYGSKTSIISLMEKAKKLGWDKTAKEEDETEE